MPESKLVESNDELVRRVSLEKRWPTIYHAYVLPSSLFYILAIFLWNHLAYNSEFFVSVAESIEKAKLPKHNLTTTAVETLEDSGLEIIDDDSLTDQLEKLGDWQGFSFCIFEQFF